MLVGNVTTAPDTRHFYGIVSLLRHGRPTIKLALHDTTSLEVGSSGMIFYIILFIIFYEVYINGEMPSKEFIISLITEIEIDFVFTP